MIKKKTGEFDMTYEERRLWAEVNVTRSLASYYEKQATAFIERAARSEFAFWNHIRTTRDLPKKDAVVSVVHDKQLVVIKNKTEYDRVVERFPQRTRAIKKE